MAVGRAERLTARMDRIGPFSSPTTRFRWQAGTAPHAAAGDTRTQETPMARGGGEGTEDRAEADLWMVMAGIFTLDMGG